MYDTLIAMATVGLAGIAAAAASCLPVIFHSMVSIDTANSGTKNNWQDRAPAIFRISRRLNAKIINYVDERLSVEKRDSLSLKLQESGLSYAINAAEVLVVRYMLTVLAAVVGIILLWVYELLEWRYLLLLVAALPLPYFYIDIWIRDAAKRRKQKIERDFPFFLDVVVLSMKAGLAFPAAIQQATTQLPKGPVQQELSRLIREVRTGSGRTEGLQRMAKRIRLASVSNFVAVVAQADETGGSLTTALNEQARQRRRERFQRAEKLANQAPVKMLFPLVAFLFPVTFIIIGFPLYEQLSGSGLFG